jgi:hypothetical protein
MIAKNMEDFKKAYFLYKSGASSSQTSEALGVKLRTIQHFFYTFKHNPDLAIAEIAKYDNIQSRLAQVKSTAPASFEPVSVSDKPFAAPEIEKQKDLELEFFAELEACQNIELAASRAGLEIKRAKDILIKRYLKIEEEATKRKNAPPIQKLASKLPKSWTTKDKAKHIVIPDVQVKPGQDFDFLRCVGEYISENMPEAVICIGDFADMPSLSTYDKGKKSAEGKRYHLDIAASKEAMAVLMAPIHKKMKETGWKPLLILTLGNHEHRIDRAADMSPEMFGHISTKDLDYESFGWTVYPFLEVVEVDGICYSHYFTTGVMGRPASSARAMIQKKHQSCVMGHVQKDEIHTEYNAKGKKITGLFVGCCYLHDEDYLGYQGNNYWRGIWMLYKIQDGSFSHLQADLDFLIDKYS